MKGGGPRSQRRRPKPWGETKNAGGASPRQNEALEEARSLPAQPRSSQSSSSQSPSSQSPPGQSDVRSPVQSTSSSTSDTEPDTESAKDSQQEEADVRLFLAGDQAAFERLVVRYEARIRKLAFGFVRDFQLAEDIAQDAFLQAFRRAHTLKNPSSFRSWLFSIALNRARDELRRSARFAHVEDLEEPLRSFREPPTSERLLESREAGRLLARLIAELPEKQRTPLMLKEASGMKYAEIAELLDVPMGTVQIRIHRARLRLRDRLSALGYRGQLSAAGSGADPGVGPKRGD